MTAQPFLTFPIRGKKDVIRARQRARQVASLLQFSPQDQACLAAGTFVIACQALESLGTAVVCFQLEDAQLKVFANVEGAPGEANHPVNRITCLPARDGLQLRLVKPLPADSRLAEADLAWLVNNVGETRGLLFEEVIKQNQEVLMLLHTLHASGRAQIEDQPIRPSAA
jgi:hypothetical protein